MSKVVEHGKFVPRAAFDRVRVDVDFDDLKRFLYRYHDTKTWRLVQEDYSIGVYVETPSIALIDIVGAFEQGWKMRGDFDAKN